MSWPFVVPPTPSRRRTSSATTLAIRRADRLAHMRSASRRYERGDEKYFRRPRRSAFTRTFSRSTSDALGEATERPKAVSEGAARS